MNENPYSPPATPPDGLGARIAFSRLRIPLAGLCAAIAVLFVFTFFRWATELSTSGVSSPGGRLAVVYVPLSVAGMLAFGLIAFGLFRKRTRAAKAGLSLFAVGALVQGIVSIVTS
jgi:hypothetical protein